MCGFLCIVSRNNQNNFSIDKKILNHRGPDTFSSIKHLNLRLSHWRLSIVDLTKNSDQPIQDDKFIFAYNGEIYEHDKWTEKYQIKQKGDTRKVFERIKNTNSVKDLFDEPGFFSLIFYDKKKRIIKAARDKIGKKPLYYYLDEQLFIISSEENGILPFIKKLKINKLSVNNYFLYKERFYGKTIFSKIYEVAPGSEINFNIKKWDLKVSTQWKYYYKHYNSTLSIPYKKNIQITNYNKLEFEKKFRDIFLDSVSSRLKCDVPVQLALSGGIDSFMIGEAIKKNLNSNKLIKSITVNFTSQGEAKLAKNNSTYLGIKNSLVEFKENTFYDILEKAIKYNSGPLEHPHSLAYFLLCKEAKLKGKVLITGEGADELLFGYNHYLNFHNHSFAFREFLNKRDEALFGKNSFDVIRDTSKTNDLRNYSIKNILNSRDMEFKTHLLSLLRRNDRMGMANSIEIRSPFLDPRLINFVLNSNFHDLYKNKNNFMKSLYKNIYIQKNILNRKKIGFRVPFDEFIFKNRNSQKLKSIIEMGIELINETSNLKLKNKKKIYLYPRLAWVLINLGVTKKMFFN
jgi:asparagine synthase (glutamine-hydrolysing)